MTVFVQNVLLLFVIITVRLQLYVHTCTQSLTVVYSRREINNETLQIINLHKVRCTVEFLRAQVASG